VSRNWVAHQREGLGKQGPAIDKPVTAVIEALLNTSLGLIRGVLCPLSGMEHDSSDHSLQRIAFPSCSNTPWLSILVFAACHIPSLVASYSSPGFYPHQECYRHCYMVVLVDICRVVVGILPLSV